MTDFDAIKLLATEYFEGLYTGDVARLSAVFHDRSRLHVMLDGKLSETEFGPYMTMVANRASPQSSGAARDDRLIAIHQTTATTAVLIVSLLLSGKSYTDTLTLIKDQSEWKIIAKVFHLNNPAT